MLTLRPVYLVEKVPAEVYPPFLMWAAHVLLQAQQPALLRAAHPLTLSPLDGAGWSVGGGSWADLMSIRLFRCGRSSVSARGKALSRAQSTLLFAAEQNDQHSRPCGESVEFY